MTQELEKLQRKGTVPTCQHCHATVLSSSQPNLMGTTTDIAQELAQQIPDNNDMITMQMHVSKRAAVLAALAATPAVGGEALPAWEDAQVQIVYETICQTDENVPPNPEEHWEGWMARRIVAALRAAPPASPLRGRDSVIEECAAIAENYGDAAEGSRNNRRRIGIAEAIRTLKSASPPEQPAAVKMYKDLLAARDARIAELEDRLSKAAFATPSQSQ